MNSSKKIFIKKNFYFFPNFWIKNFELIYKYNLLLNKDLEQNVNFIFFFSILNPTKFKQIFDQNEKKLLFIPSKILKSFSLELSKNNVFVCILTEITDVFFFRSLLSNNCIFLLQIFFKEKLLSVPYFFGRLINLKKNYFLLAKNINDIYFAIGCLDVLLKQIFIKICKTITQILLY